jgi:hypothetical protein
MTDDKQRAEIQKIEETIRNLQRLKKQGLLPTEQADASITALKNQLESYSVELDGEGVFAQGTSARAAGKGSVMVDGNLTDALILTGDGNEVTIGSEPHAKKESLREAYLSYVLDLTSPLPLGGVVRQSASEAETRLDLSAVYTALRTTLPVTRYGLDSSTNTFEVKIDIGSEIIDEDDLDFIGKVSEAMQDYGPKTVDEFPEQQRTRRYSVVPAQRSIGVSVLWHVNKKARLVFLGDPGSG